ncbi:1-(5-phosphoribosyl)-5-[(5-phosphoribosylamino)methylideneamino]imidazole-4-carboxamide isomerase [Opitutaceae bacterium TAV4]|nr:1-(5-phosphoribosyl)-5-[(5-phosphoribosylamino)methylideneamino]imidazole-4-carboxamide isomerase [Opitutaceae bacterium TAV4]RRJ97296.1 1-(5-phosphoribosyl)-5-[(5-phosphoribosylamino)methylideneamino]imidazole-4-carboxamide isomerase [Opitutaceae bacterium TAV4]RRJ98633.1 1-(5-phosphoribosyl)-5-[(5-phosphoribosylamino)methylideneamino]imidazole-4-carboxamide isomerase [Opitutaceae bacterium TAV3]
MTIYPAIDIKRGRCVRLTQGRADQETVYFENPADIATQFKTAGSPWVHVVDLDGAFAGEPQNLTQVQAIAALGMKVQLGGGLRTRAAVERALGFGVSRVVIGTRAAESESFVGELVQTFGDKIAVGIDAKNGQVAVKGWVSTTGTGALDLARRMSALGVRTIIYTDIGTDGMLTGPNFVAQEAMCEAVAPGVASQTGTNIIASGGVSRREDVIGLADLARRRANLDGVIVGKAIYEKRVNLPDLLQIAAA